jgi:hypothetical protein
MWLKRKAAERSPLHDKISIALSCSDLSVDEEREVDAWTEALTEVMPEILNQCLGCGEKNLHDWKAPVGGLAPEMWETLREKGFDPATGHKTGCAEAQRRYADRS